MTSYWATKLPEGQRHVHTLRRGSRFRMAHDTGRAGRVIDHGESGCYVLMDATSSRSFTTAGGEVVSFPEPRKHMTISNETAVLAYRATREAGAE